LKNKMLLLLSVIAVSACSSMSNIEEKDTSKSHFEDTVFGGEFVYKNPKEFKETQYRIFHQASSGFVSVASIKQSAEKRGLQFCKDKVGEPGRMTIISEQNTSSLSLMPGNFPKVELIFVCTEAKAKNYTSQQSTQNQKYQDLKQLKELLDNQVITQDEFQKEKYKVLNK